MATQFLDDVIQGHQVIQSLNVADLNSGEHKFWFRIATNALSQWQHLPVLVFKGEKPGKKIMITAGVHGDEYNGVLAAQKTARELIGTEVAGTVTIVPTINMPGMLNHSRDFYSADPDASPANLNRFFPGDQNGNEAQRYLYALWNDLLKPNADLAIDLHTQTSGAAYPLYVFADFRIEQSLEMARLINPDAILNDPGDAGVLETVWNNHGVPSITVEVGMGRYTEQELISRTVTGIFNVLKKHNIVEGDMDPITSCLEGNEIVSVKATHGGFVLPHVSLMNFVEQGQLLAIQYDSFGAEIKRYTAPTSGTVLSHNVESIRAPGSLIVRLIK
ncbi:Succinylglutamate desuccinylase / Aspartoacylase family protein [Vibrio alginolyticus]|jgi:predicted deacylase|uniref:succinylglutamate desuccinylase/aspartoacylase family protein n=1 Tax=Vibrio TaxID=662 RepID=UPI0006CA6FC5|nr:MULTISPECIES: succinylglutamate desuccinylase/aspartoacylase family protein [Vibrio]MDW1968923.1 succinylglutamate desuccinylase/aspartoacylase family protein [Vibrio sp. 945]NAW54478.1 deacylase [Vibrio sp. V41_P2S12T139]NAW92633.1 deacylase [Vibrio sp. V42_P2S4T144]ALR94084.1 deacylase [Vibrio alginolyticus]ARP00758.1 Succinylglutamate desuccinylase / Aspartoacylase family protein [Vibrio alginolyticus]